MSRRPFRKPTTGGEIIFVFVVGGGLYLLFTLPVLFWILLILFGILFIGWLLKK